CVRVQSDFDVW
nr:immunoglobulin heavy chain junction region [Macaca mulatta]MOV50267.1 immunoglobulin heavy chain junction region [Macaca mulatta]MOV50507.1 immunoglobulin heavy chain junction region [Macaca mulatta]MOV50531.1 immunoglobulin heavy chain junction region [Macaca mulatta]MOV50596.1 immunoglobulin heavy chain junction region [Macaca mulatta]